VTCTAPPPNIPFPGDPKTLQRSLVIDVNGWKHIKKSNNVKRKKEKNRKERKVEEIILERYVCR